MPDKDPITILGEGVRLARGGLLDKALQHLSDAASRADPAVVAQALRHQADIHRGRCEWDAALELARRSADVAHEAGLHEIEQEALNAEAAVHMSRGDFDRARTILLRMTEVSRSPRLRGIAFQNLGFVAAEEGDLDIALTWFDSALDAFRKAGYARGVAMALMNSGRLALLRDDFDTAEALALVASIAARAIDDLELDALACFNIAEALLRRGRPAEAEQPAAQALGYFQAVGNDWRRVECLRLFGDIHDANGDLEGARRCFQTGLDLAREADVRVEVSRLEERLRALNPGETPTGATANPDSFERP